MCCFKPRSLWLFVTAITEELRNSVVFILNEETEKSLLKPLGGGGGNLELGEHVSGMARKMGAVSDSGYGGSQTTSKGIMIG